MKKTIYSFLLIFGLCTTVKSQHCGWDNTYVIILEVRDSLTSKFINDLDIIVTDSIGRPYISKWNIENYKQISIYQKTDTLKFGQNNIASNLRKGATDISFGLGRYMLLVYGNNYPKFNESGTDKIIITDKNGSYENVSITFDKNKIASMCTKKSIWDSEEALEEATIKIKLKKKV